MKFKPYVFRGETDGATVIHWKEGVKRHALFIMSRPYSNAETNRFHLGGPCR